MLACCLSFPVLPGCTAASGPPRSLDEPAPVVDSDRSAPRTTFARALERARTRLYARDFADASPAARRDTEDFLSGLVESAWRVAHAARYLAFPDFTSSRGIVGLPGLFNPDNRYRSALLDPEGSYRIAGVRGTHATLSFQFLGDYPLVAISKDLLVIDLDARAVAPGEAFALRLGGAEASANGEPWWPMPPGARAVLARETFADWANETASTMHIERLDGGHAAPDGPSQIDLAADYLDRATTLWADHYLAGLEQLPENVIPPIRPSGGEAGGLRGQQGAIARYRLEPDEALVVSLRASDAAYQSIQLGNAWFATQNPVRHQASLNRSQARVDEDGMLRFVISHRDPGVANWLDTAGAEQGYLMIRWQGIRTPLGEADQPLAERVRLDALEAVLPATTQRSTPEARAAQLAGRARLPALRH